MPGKAKNKHSPMLCFVTTSSLFYFCCFFSVLLLLFGVLIYVGFDGSNPMIPAQLLIQIPNILRIGLHDTVAYIVSLAVIFVLLSHRQNMASLIRAVCDLFPALPGKGENGFPVSVDPHVRDLLFNVSDLLF
jgi:hypothetical protein